MPLTDMAVRKAKVREKPYKISDGGGLHLLITPNGSKLWRLKYRWHKKEKLLSFGPYPLITIAEARGKRDVAKKQLLNGVDPAAKKKLDKLSTANSASNTFGALAQEYLKQREADGVSSMTLSKNKWLLEDLAAPLSARPIADINPAEVLALLKQVEASGRLETAKRLRGAIGRVFRRAIVTLKAKSDPTAALRGALQAPKVVGRAAITDERELGILLRSIDEYTGWPTVTAALQFTILTCVRPGEVRGAVRAEFDLDRAIWSIPEERMKMRRPHKVPLSCQALAVLKSVWSFSEYSELVFPSVRSNKKSLSENAMNSALRRMGFSKEMVTTHGFRSTASSILNDRGYDPDVVEAVLAHQDPNAVRRAYNRATYWDKRRSLMQEWADLLDQFRSIRD